MTAMTTRTRKVTQQQADEALAVIRHQFRSYLEETVLPADDSGPEMRLTPLCPEPKLDMAWTAGGNGIPQVAILWEDGPSEWAHTVTTGGSSEEDRVLCAAASEEFGATIKPHEYQPVTWPKGIVAEPYYSFILCLYPD